MKQMKQKFERRIDKGQNLCKDNEVLIEFMTIYRRYEELVSGWRGLEDWHVSEHQI